jgi:hypothetical protein
MMGGANPVKGKGEKVPDSTLVAEQMSSGWEEIYGGKLEFVDDPWEMIRRTLDHIDKKRAALGLPAYDPARFGKGGGGKSADARLREIEALPFEERQAALYGRRAAG